MKTKVLLITLGIIALLVLYFWWLFGANQPYKFRQELDQIVKIEIVKKEQDTGGYDVPKVVLKTIDPSEYKAFIEDLKKVEGVRIGMHQGLGFGMYIIRITYKNGEIELISDYNNGYISTDGKVHEDAYSMNKEQFYDFLSRVLGEEVTEPTFK